MELVADLHLHSKYSRAVSPQMVVPEMVKWAKLKGIDLLGTGDFTHPQWLSELKANLEECGQGVFRVKSQISNLKCQINNSNLKSEKETKFLLTTEISSIYSQGGRTRKIHNLIIAPSFFAADKISTALRARGCNLTSDGRPIVGLSAKNILELVLGVDDACLVIPCHVWTPWFSLYGANSGFDSLEECFGELSKYISAVETGLSSDPEMNWQVADLDNRSLVSFSDAHSPAKLGREATVFEVERLDFDNISGAIKEVESPAGAGGGKVKYTVEFYPEEGKYHYTGHRNCGVVQSPEETEKKGTTCAVCGKKLTVGVMERVRKLGKMGGAREKRTDENGVRWIKKEGKPPFVKLVPLAEIIAETLGVGESAASVAREYQNLTEKLGNEIGILMKSDLEEIAKIGGEKLAKGVLKVRSGDIFIKPGFDGEYGKVKVWRGDKEEEMEDKGRVGKGKEQMSLF